MAAFQQHDDDDVISSINIIPFVDIVLVLLIIFMVTSTVIARAAIQVELPRAASAGSAVESTINLVLSREGELRYDGEAVSEDEAMRRLAREVAKNPRVQAVISADRGIAYGAVVRLIDIVKLQGVETFALNVERQVASREAR